VGWALVGIAFVGAAIPRLSGGPNLGPLELLSVSAAALLLGRHAALAVAAAAASLLVAAAATGALDWLSLLGWLPVLGLSAHVLGDLAERRAAVASELDNLRPVQNALAPFKPPDLPLLEVATRYVPATSGVAGDFYLITEGHNASTVFVIGDVVGKGMDAAKRATFVRATLTACGPYSEDPAHMLRMANAELIRQYGVSAQFITMLCVVVYPDSTMSWCTAGHPPPLSLADGEPVGRARTALPLGLAPELTSLDVARCELPTAGILLYTDGLTDARPPGGSFEPLGIHRVAMFLRELPEPSPEDAVDRLMTASQTFARGKLPDDLCLVALRSRVDPSWKRFGAPDAEAQEWSTELAEAAHGVGVTEWPRARGSWR
jgi:hypothetical protein